MILCPTDEDIHFICILNREFERSYNLLIKLIFLSPLIKNTKITIKLHNKFIQHSWAPLTKSVASAHCVHVDHTFQVSWLSLTSSMLWSSIFHFWYWPLTYFKNSSKKYPEILTIYLVLSKSAANFLSS
jgi:hypothetical protein